MRTCTNPTLFLMQFTEPCPIMAWSYHISKNTRFSSNTWSDQGRSSCTQDSEVVLDVERSWCYQGSTRAVCCQSDWWSADQCSHHQAQLTALKMQPGTSTCSLLVTNVIYVGMWDWWDPATLLLIACRALCSCCRVIRLRSNKAELKVWRHWVHLGWWWKAGLKRGNTWVTQSISQQPDHNREVGQSAEGLSCLLMPHWLSPIRLCSSPMQTSVDR